MVYPLYLATKLAATFEISSLLHNTPFKSVPVDLLAVAIAFLACIATVELV